MPNRLVSHNVRVPNRKVLRLAGTVGWILIGVGVVLGLLAFYNTMSNMLAGQIVYDQYTETYVSCSVYDGLPEGYPSYETFEQDCEQSEAARPWLDSIEWYHSVIALFVGTALVITMSRLYRKYFQTVYQGRVIEKITIVYDGLWLSWLLCVEGNNLANEKIQEWVPVTHNSFRWKRAGDYVDFRD